MPDRRPGVTDERDKAIHWSSVMDYHPQAFSIGVRDVVAAWLVCLIAAMALLSPLAVTDSPAATSQAHGPTRPTPRPEIKICVAGKPAIPLRRG
jgi:hypothetical protein